jgi:hypothetical protein
MALPGLQFSKALVAEQGDSSGRPAQGVTMSRGNAVPDGVRVKLPEGMTWDELKALKATI